MKNSKALKIGKSRGIAGNLRSIFRDVINRTVLDQILIFLSTKIEILDYTILTVIKNAKVIYASILLASSIIYQQK